ncbi:MAG: FHA domain-containing protein [Candidatus Micrarchaeota archaeon]
MAFVLRVFDRGHSITVFTKSPDLSSFKDLDPSKRKILEDHTLMHLNRDYEIPHSNFSIGRSSYRHSLGKGCILPNIALDDDAVSRWHGTFHIRDGSVFYEDHSSNGTLVDGKWIDHRIAQLKVGAVLELGSSLGSNPRFMLILLELKQASGYLDLGPVDPRFITNPGMTV